jgi:hypothetical protein
LRKYVIQIVLRKLALHMSHVTADSVQKHRQASPGNTHMTKTLKMMLRVLLGHVKGSPSP